MPGYGLTGVGSIDHTDWLAPGEPIWIETLGVLIVVSIAGLDVTVQNPANGGGSYDFNAPPGTIAASTLRVTPSGFEGVAGTVGGVAGGDLQGNYPNPLLKNTGTPGTTGDATHVARITTDAAGRVTAATAVPINFPTPPTFGTMATQNANAVNVTGGNIANTPISGADGSFTTLAASAASVLSGTLALPSGSIQTIGAASTIHTTAGKVRVVGNGGPVTVGTLPTCDNGTSDGQLVVIQGTDDTNTVTVQDGGTLPGSKLRLGATTRTLGKGDTLVLMWDSADAKWYEVSYTDLV